MQVGIRDKQYITEATFLPIRENIQNWIKENNKASLPYTTMSIIDPDAPINKIFFFKKIKTIINRCYIKTYEY